MKNTLLFLSLFFLFISSSKADTDDMVTYAGGSGNDIFNDIIQISDGSFLICGGTDDLDWIDLPEAKKTEITDVAGLDNQKGTGRYAFILRMSEDLTTLLNLVYLKKGSAEELRFMKTTNVPGSTTGDIYISGTISAEMKDSWNNTRPVTVFIARLDNNFIKGVPTKFLWQHSFWGEGYVKENHPWDVRTDGKVVLAEGQSHAADFGCIYMLDENGKYTVVPKWRNHRYKFHRYQTTPGQMRDDFIEADFWGTADQHVPNTIQVNAYQRDNDFNIETDLLGNPIILETGDSIGNILYSRIYTKWYGGADLRSWTQEDFDLWQPDENGSYKKGKYPWDIMFGTPCDPNDIAGTRGGTGYTGYRTQGGSKAVFGTSVITIDRRNNDCYIGMNVSSKLPPPENNPDFEPVVIAYKEDGEMKWWSRLYHETTGGTAETVDGKLVVTGYTTQLSTPDQYVDGIAVDYSKSIGNAEVIVNARCHGNNVENLWEGNTVAANPGGYGFKNGYSGTGGDMHIGWLGRMKSDNGQLMNSTYIAEYAEGANLGGDILSDPNLDGWPNPNSGWPNLTTTRVTSNSIKVSAYGYPLIISSGRRTITTANANQKMWKPSEGTSSWNMFVRVYKSDLTLPLYSSLACGEFGTDGEGGNNTYLTNAWKTKYGAIAIGRSNVNADGVPAGNLIQISNVPSWGKSTREKQDAVLFHFKADNIKSQADGYDDNIVSNKENNLTIDKLNIRINGDFIEITGADKNEPVVIYNIFGNQLITTNAGSSIDISSLLPGVYVLSCNNESVKFCK